MARNRKTQSRRYYYQNCLKAPFEVNGESKQIVVDGITKHIELPFAVFLDIPKPWRFYVGQLINKWGYNVQYKLLTVAPKVSNQAPSRRTPVRKPPVIKKKALGQLKLL
jgi:hypothetical protein